MEAILSLAKVSTARKFNRRSSVRAASSEDTGINYRDADAEDCRLRAFEFRKMHDVKAKMNSCTMGSRRARKNQRAGKIQQAHVWYARAAVEDTRAVVGLSTACKERDFTDDATLCALLCTRGEKNLSVYRRTDARGRTTERQLKATRSLPWLLPGGSL